METVARFARAIAPDGFLFLAHSETLLGVSGDFHLQHSHSCFYYCRRAPSVRYREPGKGTASARDLQVVPPILSSGLLTEAIRAAALGSSTLDERSVPETGERERSELAHEAGGPKPNRSVCFDQAMELVQAGHVHEALSVVQQVYPKDDGADRDVIALAAAILAELGRTKEAAQLCSSLLGVDDLNPSAHYLMGFCNEQNGWRATAIERYQTAIYLDPTFAMPHLHLGMLFRREADLHRARHELAEAALLLAREDSARILLFGNGFSRGTLLDLCRSELRLCESHP